MPTDLEFLDKITSLKKNNNINNVSLYFKRNGAPSIGTSNYFYIKLHNSKDFEILQQIATKKDVQIVKQVPNMPLWYILSLKKTTIGNTIDVANYFYETGLFADIDPAFMFNFKNSCANDTNFGSLWGLNNTTNPNIDINACQAWNIAQGSGVKVAVLDQGIYTTHNDLAGNMSTLSFDSQTGTSPSVFNGASHGTHVAGTIAAIKDNNLQVVGVAPLSKIMAVSHSLFLTPNISAELASGISWAYLNGADIINNSWGDQGGQFYNQMYSAILENAILNAITLGRNNKGTVVVFASGNFGVNTPIMDYPATFNDNIVTVGSITNVGQRSIFNPTRGSGYGNKLDIVAPGSDILSTIPNNQVGNNSGTSMASPHVSGVCALILSANPCLTGQQVRDIIEQTSQKVGGYSYTTTLGRPNGPWNEQMGYGLIDAYAAVLMAQSMIPQISGINTICTTANYAAPTGGTSHNWIITSGSNLVTISNGAIANVTVTAVPNASGQITLSLNMGSSCGNQIATKTIWVGKPQISYVDFTNDLGGNDFCVNIRGKNKANFVISTTTPSVLQYHYQVFRGTTLLKDIVSSSPNGFFTTSIAGSYTVQIRIKNACGWSAWENYNVFFERCAANRMSSNLYSIYPNPSSETVYIDLVDQNNLPDKGAIISCTLFDLMGQAKSKVQITDTKATLSVQGLNKGVYVLEILINDYIESHQIIVE